MKKDSEYDYMDSFSHEVHLSRPISAKEFSEQFFSAPRWIVALMRLRNAVVKPFGLKVEKDISDLIIVESDSVAIISKNDQHLDLVISFMTERRMNDSQRLSVSTKVRYNKRMGKLYFAIIRPFHNIICKTLLKRAKGRIETKIAT